VADHAAFAGRTLPPSKEFARRLVAEADHAADTEPDRATRWYRAALWHLDSDDPARPQVLSALLRLLASTGQYALLGTIGEEFAGEAVVDRKQLAAAAVLSALHTCTPMPNAVRAVLAGEQTALACHDRWFAGGTVDVPDLLSVTAALSNGPSAVPRDELADAAAMSDLAALFETGIGAGIPIDGPLAQYHRVVTGYARGDWQLALSAARQLELTRSSDGPATPAHHLGSLLAAEICTAQADLKQASAWLDSIGEDGRFTAMRGWVDSGTLTADGDTARALAAGWWAYRRIGTGEKQAGAERLLSRLAVVAMGCGHTTWGQPVLAEMVDLDNREHSPASAQALLFVRGVVTGDESSLRAGAEMARHRGHLPDLLMACLALGELSMEPQPWLHEAHEIAQRLGSAPLRAEVKALMRRRGIALPRLDDGRPTLSDTELRIVELLQDGRTNRQISAALRVTEKTVEYYLSRMFVKTGCRSRVDLVAARVRGQLTAASA